MPFPHFPGAHFSANLRLLSFISVTVLIRDSSKTSLGLLAVLVPPRHEFLYRWMVLWMDCFIRHNSPAFNQRDALAR